MSRKIIISGTILVVVIFILVWAAERGMDYVILHPGVK